MHTKHKGNIAQSSVVLILQENGFNVFSELGDVSKIDLIAEKGGELRKIQIKYVGYVKDYVFINIKKSGPNGYRYTYKSKDVDWFAVYHLYSKKIAWVKAKEVCKYNTGINIRINPVKNKQKKNVRSIDDYGIDRFLRDFTQDIVPLENDEDKVQTTTLKDGSGN